MRILVARIGRAGDIVMTTPALKALLDCFPKARFTLLTSPDGNRLLRTYDTRIDDIWVWDRSSLGASIEKLRIRKKLRGMTFDKIFCFETSTSIAQLFNNISTEFHHQKSSGGLVHTAQSSLDLVSNLCPENVKNARVNLPVDHNATQLVDNELAQLGIEKNDVIIGLHPTYSGFSTFNLRKRAARKHKLWPAENFGHLAEKLSGIKMTSGKHPKIIIDLLDDEMPLGRRIVKFSGGSVQLLNKKPNIERYKALLKRYNLLISPDTGPMHMAAAVDTRIVALFSGKNPDNCGPFTRQEMFTVLRSEDTATPENGISAINTESVFNACKKQLSKIEKELYEAQI